MKNFLKYSDLIFLRLIPLAYLAICIYASISFSLPMWGKGISILDIMTDNVIIFFCFLFLGCASVFRKFVPTEKVAAIFKYLASVVAVVYILGYVIKLIWFLSWGVSPSFFRSVIEWQDEVRVVGFALLIVCCFLKDSFYKLKWGFTILCAVLFFMETTLPVSSLMAYHDPLVWRFMLNSLISVYCCSAAVVMGLAPVKKKAENGVETLILGE